LEALDDVRLAGDVEKVAEVQGFVQGLWEERWKDVVKTCQNDWGIQHPQTYGS